MAKGNLSMYELLLKNSNKKYNQKRADKCLMFLKKSTKITDAQRDELMVELFCLTSPIIIKAINNFRNLTKQYKNKLFHTEEDIVSECYLGMYRCVLNVKWSEYKKFHFYLNSSLNKIVYRLVQRSYIKHKSTIDNTSDNEYMIENNSAYNDHVDFIDMSMERLDLSDIEREIIKMKVEGLDFQQFLKQNSISHIKYKQHLELLQSKLKETYGLESDNVMMYNGRCYKSQYVNLLKTRDLLKKSLIQGHHYAHNGRLKLDLMVIDVMNFDGWCELKLIDRDRNLYTHILRGDKIWWTLDCWMLRVHAVLEHTTFQGNEVTLLKLKEEQEFEKEMLPNPTPYYLYNLKD